MLLFEDFRDFKELKCMPLHIMRVGLKRLKLPRDGLYHFLLVVFT